MHDLVNQKRFKDELLSKRMLKLFMASADAGSPARYQKRKRKLADISRTFPNYYCALFFYASSTLARLKKISEEKLGSKTVDGFRETLSLDAAIKIIIDNLVRETGDRYSIGEVDTNIGIQFYLFHDNVALAPQIKIDYMNFKLLVNELRKKGAGKEMIKGFSVSLKELQTILSVYIYNYESFKKTKNIYASHAAFRELNWAIYSWAAFVYRWGPVYQWLSTQGMKSLKREFSN